jgi:hypothetical protein
MNKLEINPGAVVIGKTGTPLKVLAIDADGDLILQKPDLSEVVAKRSAIIEILEPPKLPIREYPSYGIGTKVKLTVTIGKRIDGQTGKVVAIVGPTIRRVRWQLWEEAIERNLQLSYLQEVAA